MLANGYFGIGAKLWHLGEEEAARGYLARSAERTLVDLTSRPVPAPPAMYSPHFFVQDLGRIATFGARGHRAALADLPRDRFDYPPRRHTLATDSAALVRSRLATGELDLGAARQMMAACDDRDADRVFVEEVGPSLGALVAIEEGQQAAFTEAVEAMLGYHEWLATRGAFVRLDQGLLAMKALLAMTLGKERGLVAEVVSPYAPAALVS